MAGGAIELVGENFHKESRGRQVQHLVASLLVGRNLPARLTHQDFDASNGVFNRTDDLGLSQPRGTRASGV